VVISNEDFEEYRIKKGDLLFNRTNSYDLVGKTAVAEADIDSVFASYIVRFKTKTDRSNPFFVGYFFNGHYAKHQLKSLATKGVSQCNINPSILRKHLYLPLPPLSEQRKIAEILRTWDRAIELVEKQIEAKQRLKKGLMQQLLTGKMRFPGFEEEWREVPLKQVTKLLVSNIDKKSNEDEAPVVLCNYMDVYENEYITSTIRFMPATATATEIKKFSLQVGDVILTKDSETREDIASTAVVIDKVKKLVCGYHLAILRPNSAYIDSIFLAKLLSHGRIHHHFVAYASGATRFGLTISAIENAKINLPSKSEQYKISQIFYNIDKEIEKLISKTDILQRQKQGLMQKLLTGEVRVSV
jgi:type I restriction enzyme S subunit